MKPRYFFVVWCNPVRGTRYFRHAVPCLTPRPTFQDVAAALAAELAADGIPAEEIRVLSARETEPLAPILEQPASPALP